MRDLEWRRVVSLVVAAAYVVSAFTRSGQVAGLEMILYCVVPVACIWFPEALGEYVGGRITDTSPAAFVSTLGWVVLLVPLLERALWYFYGGHDWLL